MSEEVILAKKLDYKDNQGLIIRIVDSLPNLLDLQESYDSNSYFRDQAQRLSDALFNHLPAATVHELLIIMTKRLYGIEV